MNDAHETLEPLLSSYLDAELDPTRRRRVEAHLATCAICAQELAHLRTGDEVLAGLQLTPMAPDLRTHLRRRLRRQGARTALTGGLITVIVLLLRGVADARTIMKRKDLPFWGRLGMASSYVLLVAPGIALCIELLRDIRALAEYAWLSDETSESGEPQP